ncbi:MAG: ABC transporter permease [Fibrobacteria bacterium]|nr:ABC transporter permease [Fibrobacteria bacterium]
MITLLVVISASYFLMKIAPGNPWEGERSLSPQALNALKQKYDFTLWEYLSGIIFSGDFRYSYQHRDMRVSQIIMQTLPCSIELGLWALLLALFFGTLGGTGAALLKGSGADNFIMVFALIGIAIPNFVIGPILQLFFSLKLNITPVAGWSSFSSKILPSITLSLMYISYISRICRSSLLETGTKDFIRTAKAKGLSGGQIMRRHIFRNSLLPLVNFLGPATAALITGTLVVEKIFNIPGMGRYFVESALQRDYPVALGVLIVFSALLLLFNLITDILQAFIDPRIRLV